MGSCGVGQLGSDLEYGVSDLAWDRINHTGALG